MKADERHKLRHNELAHYLAVSRDWLSRNRSTLITVGLLVVAVVLVVTMLAYRRNARQTQAWNEMSATWAQVALSLRSDRPDAMIEPADRFGKIAADYAGLEPVETFAQYYRGRTLMLYADQRGMVNNIAGFNDTMVKADEAFGRVLALPYHSLITPAAQVGLAVNLENRGKFTEAIALFEKVHNDGLADAEMRRTALERRNNLKDRQTTVVFAPAPVPTTTAEDAMRNAISPEVPDLLRGSGTEYTLPIPSAGPNTGEPGRSPTTQKD